MRVILAILGIYVGYRLVKKGYDMTQDQDVYLAKTIWGEARGEGLQGMQAVANVVMNRVNAASWYGASIKDVVLKPYQFSCWNANDPNRAKIDRLSIEDLAASGALNVARQVISGKLKDITGGATNYHATSVNPAWAAKMTKTVQIGNHVFYKEK